MRLASLRSICRVLLHARGTERSLIAAVSGMSRTPRAVLRPRDPAKDGFERAECERSWFERRSPHQRGATTETNGCEGGPRPPHEETRSSGVNRGGVASTAAAASRPAASALLAPHPRSATRHHPRRGETSLVSTVSTVSRVCRECVESVSRVCRECVESVEPGLNRTPGFKMFLQSYSTFGWRYRIWTIDIDKMLKIFIINYNNYPNKFIFYIII